MTLTVQLPGVCPNTSVLRGNGWAQPVTLPTADADSNPLSWGTFTVTADETTEPFTVVWSSPVLTISLTGAQTAALVGRWVHWYVAEDTVMGGSKFLTGRIELTDPQ